MATGESNLLLAMIALNSATLPEPSLIFESFKQHFPASPLPSNLKVNKEIIHFDLTDDMAAVALMPAPIPWSDLEGPCATAWWWPDATESMKNHSHHLLVTLSSESPNAIERHIRLTQVVAAAAANSDAAGVYWGNGTVVHEPSDFIEKSAQLSPESIEPRLWIDMRLGQNEDGSFHFFTTGMKWFCALEIEISQSRRPPDEILDFCCCMVDYIVTQVPTIKDGHTIGRSAEEKIKVSRGPSMWKRGTVMKLAFT